MIVASLIIIIINIVFGSSWGTFWKTLQKMRHGCTGTMSKPKSNHHSGCPKTSPRPKKFTLSAFTRQRWCWRYFWILRVLFTMSFYHKAGQSIRSIIWKLCKVFLRQSGKKRPDAWRENRWMLPTWQHALTSYDAIDMHYVPRPQESHVTCVWQFCNSEMVNVCVRWTQTFHSVAVLTLPLRFWCFADRASQYSLSN